MMKEICPCVFQCMIQLTAAVVAGNTGEIDRAVSSVIRSLPPGWTLAERKSGEIPWGHHWDQNYTGPKGLLVIAKGTRPVDAEFGEANGKWRAVRVATESLEIWLMPSNYSDPPRPLFAISRPIQPRVVLD